MADPGDPPPNGGKAERRVRPTPAPGSITREVDATRRLVRLTFTGTIAPEMIRAVQRDPEFDPTRPALLDCTQADVSELDLQSIKALAASSPVASTARRAFVVADEAAYGVARMFRAASQIAGRGAPIEVFRDRQQALQWLMADPAEPAPVLVLIVEDEVLIRMAVADHLRRSGYAVVEAGDPVQAFGILHRTPAIDLVLTDIRMPGPIDGYGLARWIRKNRPALPVITATAVPTLPAPWDETGERPDIIKPYDYGDVERRIRAVLAAR